MYKERFEKDCKDIKIAERCCECGKEQVFPGNLNDWHKFPVYYYDTDSKECNSYDCYSVCSFECYLKRIKKSVEELKDSRTAIIDEMEISFVKKVISFNEF